MLLLTLPARALTVTATYNAATDVPVTSAGYTATGNTVNITLNYAPVTGTELTVVKNTGLDFISGTFGNLTQGQIVAAAFSGTTYYFTANYYGGTGNDLVLIWANTRAFAWGANTGGQLGDNTTTQRNLPVAVNATGALAGKTVVRLAHGQTHSMALCSDGTLAAWGQNDYGQLGDGTTTPHIVPAKVTLVGTPLAGKTIVAIAAGTYHSMALCSDGTVAAWGYNNSGQLGDSTLINRSLPTAVTVSGTGLAGRSVVGICGGYFSSLALCSDGRVAAWGYNANGQLGDTTSGASPIPVLVALNGPLFGRTVIAIAGYTNHTLALCSDNLITSWGYNFGGQLGDNSSGTSATRYSPVSVITSGTPLAGKSVLAVATGEHHSMALCGDGTVVAWGLNTNGQLGDNTVINHNLPATVTTAGTALSGKTVVGLGGGLSHSLALCSDGTLAAWGLNSSGQLGDNSVNQRSGAVAVGTSSLPGGARFTRVFDGSYANHSLALVASPAAAPPTVTTTAATAVIATGATLSGLVYAYGNNTAVSFDYGLSSAYGTNVAGSPTPVTGNTLTSVSANLTGLTPNTTYHYRVNGVSSAGSTAGADMTFATLSNNANLSGLTISNGALSPAFASGTTSYNVGVNTAHLTFTPVAADANAVIQMRVNNGSYTTLTSGSPTSSLILGVGVTSVEFKITSSDATVIQPYTVNITRAAPTPVVYTYNSASGIPITAGSYEATDNTVALTLNYAPVAGTELTIVKNTGLPYIDGVFSNLAQGQAVALAYGGNTYNFVANYYGGSGNDLVLVWAATRVFAWGQNSSGQLGDNSTTQRLLPVRSGGALYGKTLLSLAGGTNHCLALCSDGTLVSWGRNYEGQLGDNSGVEHDWPAVVPTAGTPLQGRRIIAIAAGGGHSLALCSDGTLAAWGDNQFGQVGDNTITQRNVPVAVVTAGTPLAGKTVIAIAAGVYHSVALCSDGTVATWGWNQQGQLGDNTNTQRNKPVAVVTTGTALAGKTVASIAAGWGHTLALGTDGTVAAWGIIGFGLYSNLPVAFSGTGALVGKTASAIAAGYNNSLVLCTEGTIAGWGYNGTGALGDGTTSSRDTPVAVTASGVLAGKTVISIATGYSQGFALCSDGTLAAWGDNTSGQLGDNTTTNRLTPVLVNTSTLAAGERCVRIPSSSYTYYTLAITGAIPTPDIVVYDGSGTTPAAARQNNVGNSSFNPVPVGNTSSPQTFTIQNIGTGNLTPLTVPAPSGGNAGDFTVNTAGMAATLAPGATTTFTVTFSPTATGTRSSTVQVASNDPAKSPFVINVQGNVTLSATYNAAGNVPATASSYTASGKLVDLVLGLVPAVGTELTVVKNTGLGFINGAFSNLAQGQAVTLGYGGNTYNFIANYYGGSGNDLVLVWAANRAFAWGGNGNGQLGDNSVTQRNQAVPVTATGALAGKTLFMVATGSAHSLALCSDGTLAAWGSNSNGQLGDNSTTQRLTPVAVTTAGTPLAGKTVVAIAVGDSHSMALCSDGTLAAWGFNSGGQLGDNSVTQRLVPVAVTTTGTPLAGKTVVAIAAGRHHSLALSSDGTMAAWGLNADGQLGDNSTTSRNVPIAVTTTGTPLAGKTVATIAAGSYHSLALCSDGTLTAWGQNGIGQLGDGTGIQRNIAVPVTTAGTPLAGKTIVALASGSTHSLALCTDGTLAAWGNNFNGQLGDTSNTTRLVPVAVNFANGTSALYGKTVVAISAGANHSRAYASDGTLTAWGQNNLGQLGDGTVTQRFAPVPVNSAALAPGERVIRSAGGTYADHALALVASGSPEISAFDGNGTGGAERQSNVANFVCPSTLTGSSGAAQTFTIQNVGTASLDFLAVTKTGAHPGDFTLGTLGATTLIPGATTTFTVTFSPTVAGARSAVIQIASNDSNENPFLINLNGTALTAQENWRKTYFTDPSNTGAGADLNDFDKDGIANLAEYALGLNPTQNSASQLPQAQRSGGDFKITINQPLGVSGITYGAEWSSSLQSGSWNFIPDTGIPPQHVFSVPTAAHPKLMMRIRITSP